MGRGSDEVIKDLLGLRDKAFRLFDDPSHPPAGGRERLAPRWEPPVDIYETAADYVLLAEIPGMEQDDIHLEVNGDLLVLEGERPSCTAEPGISYHRMERPEGPFRRVFQLPAEVAPDRISATCRDGVLRVTLPRRELPTGRTIAVRLEE